MQDHVVSYMASVPKDFMYSWESDHMMEMTANSVESCMKWLKEDIFGLENAREASLFNRYRFLECG